MVDKKFSINNRFLVDEALNLVKDLENNQEHRLEPRLMSVLCMLSSHEGELVTRDQLIAEIWNNYGGAEDSLNQAISFLRKTLQDAGRELIVTIPKKGYILHATIRSLQQPEKGKVRKIKFNVKHPVFVSIITLALLTAAYFLLNNKVTNVQEQKIVKESVEVDFSQLNKSEEENYFNTITTTGRNGTKYRLVAIGDKRPKLYVNGKLISGPELEEYSEIEGQLLRQLWDRQNKHADTISNDKSK